MQDPDYVVASHIFDGVLFELIVSQVDVALVQKGHVTTITTTPRVRMIKSPETTIEVQEK